MRCMEHALSLEPQAMWRGYRLRGTYLGARASGYRAERCFLSSRILLSSPATVTMSTPLA